MQRISILKKIPLFFTRPVTTHIPLVRWLFSFSLLTYLRLWSGGTSSLGPRVLGRPARSSPPLSRKG